MRTEHPKPRVAGSGRARSGDDNRPRRGDMGTQARQSSFVLPLLVGLAAIAAACAGTASMRDRTTAASGQPVVARLPVALPPTESPQRERAAVDGPEGTGLPQPGAIRNRSRCSGCGTVESVRRIDRREFAAGSCSVAESDHFPTIHNARDGDERGVSATLAETVEGVLIGRPGKAKMKVASSYEIVVRFRDGSRHVLNESTACAGAARRTSRSRRRSGPTC